MKECRQIGVGSLATALVNSVPRWIAHPVGSIRSELFLPYGDFLLDSLDGLLQNWKDESPMSPEYCDYQAVFTNSQPVYHMVY